MENGSITHRNRRLLRPDKTILKKGGPSIKKDVSISDKVRIKEIPPRDSAPSRARSARKKKTPKRYLD